MNRPSPGLPIRLGWCPKMTPGPTWPGPFTSLNSSPTTVYLNYAKHTPASGSLQFLGQEPISIKVRSMMDYKHGAFVNSLFDLSAWTVSISAWSRGWRRACISLAPLRSRCHNYKREDMPVKENGGKAGEGWEKHQVAAQVWCCKGEWEGTKFGSKTLRL